MQADRNRAPGVLNVTTHQLQYLVAMDRAESLSEAAADLGISTSALSQALSELERRVGLPLFERRGRARALGPRGREMVAHAERVLGATRDLTLWAEAAAIGSQGSIRLGLIDLAAVVHFPEALLRLRAERPDVDLQLTVAPSAALVEQVAEGRLDLAVVVEPPRPPTAAVPPPDRETGPTGGAPGERSLVGHDDLVAIDLLAEELAVYGPPDLAGRRLPPGRWGPWITFPPSSHTRRMVAQALRSLGVDFRVEAESHQPDVVRQLVHLGLGWTVLPVVQAEAEPTPLVRARPAPLLTRRLVLTRRRATPVDPVAQEVIERLRASAGAGRDA